ncbi:MAG: hypothetical protein ABFC65_00955, partial [Rectinema sp.]
LASRQEKEPLARHSSRQHFHAAFKEPSSIPFPYFLLSQIPRTSTLPLVRAFRAATPAYSARALDETIKSSLGCQEL